jgi:hypothetical protein
VVLQPAQQLLRCGRGADTPSNRAHYDPFSTLEGERSSLLEGGTGRWAHPSGRRHRRSPQPHRRKRPRPLSLDPKEPRCSHRQDLAPEVAVHKPCGAEARDLEAMAKGVLELALVVIQTQPGRVVLACGASRSHKHRAVGRIAGWDC